MFPQSLHHRLAGRGHMLQRGLESSIFIDAEAMVEEVRSVMK